MDEHLKVVSLDDAFDCYEMSKRIESKKPVFYYDVVKNKFCKIKGSIKENGVLFINANQLCLKLIDEYLNIPDIRKHKNSFEREWGAAKNKVVSFLWFFEHIDGAYGFQEYEMLRVVNELKAWCKNNGFGYLEPEIYKT